MRGCVCVCVPCIFVPVCVPSHRRTRRRRRRRTRRIRRRRRRHDMVTVNMVGEGLVASSLWGLWSSVAGCMRMQSRCGAWLTLLLLVLLMSPALVAAQLNQEQWPDTSTWPDVSDKALHLSSPFSSEQGCFAQLARYSFTGPAGLSTAAYKPEVVPGSNPQACQGPWASVVVTARFQTTDVVPAKAVFGVWIKGVDVLRGYFPDVAANSPQGLTQQVWVIEKDITQFSSLLRTPGGLAKAALDYTQPGPNPAQAPYPTINVTVTALMYSTYTYKNAGAPASEPIPASVLPISRSSPPTSMPWYPLYAHTSLNRKLSHIPRNAVAAYLEVHGSPAGSIDDLSYEAVATQLKVMIDNRPAGYAYVGFGFGGPLDVGYVLDVTPFVGTLVDGKLHSFTIKNSHDNYLLVDANLLVHVDASLSETRGELLEATSALPLRPVDGTNPTPSDFCAAYPGYEECQYLVASAPVVTRGYMETSDGTRVFTNVTQTVDYVYSYMINPDSSFNNYEHLATMQESSSSLGEEESASATAATFLLDYYNEHDQGENQPCYTYFSKTTSTLQQSTNGLPTVTQHHQVIDDSTYDYDTINCPLMQASYQNNGQSKEYIEYGLDGVPVACFQYSKASNRSYHEDCLLEVTRQTCSTA
eukprot:jgi/Chlat1/2471/Chrsp175S02354